MSVIPFRVYILDFVSVCAHRLLHALSTLAVSGPVYSRPPLAPNTRCPIDPLPSSVMSSTSSFSTLAVLARSKMQSVFGGGIKDASGLHRWVLLKNSLVCSQPTLPAQNNDAPPSVHSPGQPDDEDDEADSFMFPLLDDVVGQDASESEWLDSLLETLGDDEEDLEVEGASLLSVDDDDSNFLSPASSSEDLGSPSLSYTPPPIRVPYPIPYPPVAFTFELGTPPDSDPFSTLFQDALPYPFFELDDTEDMLVPDAIEDTSDDESDAPLTPSSQSLTMASVPGLRSGRHARRDPRIYIDTDDPFPFADMFDDPEPHNPGMHAYEYQEC